jgi:glycerol-3-phosphate dehydrogenase
VVLNAVDAAERGARILTRTELVDAHRDADGWQATIRGTDEERVIRARALVNAAGPWAAQLFDRIAGLQRRRSLRLVKGSHIVVPRLHPAEHAFLLQNADGRIVFAIPFEGRFTLVGTTDVDLKGPPGQPAISDEEVDYLLGAIAAYFAAPVTRDDIVWSYSGIRALLDDGTSDPSKVTREYSLELDAGAGQAAPLLTVFGGKITTYRRLAEQAVNRLAPMLVNKRGRWTEGAVLPGGDIQAPDFQTYAFELAKRHAALPPEMIGRLARTYGSRTEAVLDGVSSVADLGEHFGAGLYAREVDYLVSREWAGTAEDVLFRRTKLGLHLDESAADRVNAYLGAS